MGMAEGRITESRNSWRGGLAEKRKFFDPILYELDLQPHFCYSTCQTLLACCEPGVNFCPLPAPREPAGQRRRARTATCGRPAAAAPSAGAPRAQRGHSAGLRSALSGKPTLALGRRAASKGHGLRCLKDIYCVLRSIVKPLSCRASHRQ